MSGVACGKVSGHWIPGTAIPGGYFLSDAHQAHNYDVRARHETGRARKMDLATGKHYTKGKQAAADLRSRWVITADAWCNAQRRNTGDYLPAGGGYNAGAK